MLPRFASLHAVGDCLPLCGAQPQRNSVTDYVACLKACVNKLKGTYRAPSEGSVVMKFPRGLKLEVAKFVNQNAPHGWWQEGDVDKVLEFQRRLKAKRCVMCGKEKHGRCDKKDATPFV